MEETKLSQVQAQIRADQIHAFQIEMHELEREGVVALTPEQAINIENHHQQLLHSLSSQFDVDMTAQSKQLTLGMKIASLLGALAMAISIFFLFYQFWGYLSTWIQVSILVVAPVSLLLLSLKLTQKESSAYFSKIAALVGLATFVLNLSMLGQIFNISPSPNAFAVWAAFGFVLAYTCNARLLLLFSIISVSCFIAMKIGTWSGVYWINFGERPEHFFIPALIIFLTPQWVEHHKFTGFAAIYRICGLIMACLPILILANWGKLSYLTWPSDIVEGVYQIIGFAISTVAVWLGIKQHWNDVINTGNVFFILFLYTKFYDWWWQWMPKYIFFFLLGLSALLALFIFKRLRTHMLDKEIQ